MPERRTVNKSVSAESPELPQTDDLKVAAMIESYEKSSGSLLTPRDLEKLKDFADTYPDGWFEKAIEEYPGKPLSYLEKILESWQKEGPSGKNRKHTRQLRPRDGYTESGNDDV